MNFLIGVIAFLFAMLVITVMGHGLWLLIAAILKSIRRWDSFNSILTFAASPSALAASLFASSVFPSAILFCAASVFAESRASPAYHKLTPVPSSISRATASPAPLDPLFRFTHFVADSTVPGGRATIGNPFRKFPKSSASSFAVR